jgi:hypothetical protein
MQRPVVFRFPIAGIVACCCVLLRVVDRSLRSYSVRGRGSRVFSFPIAGIVACCCALLIVRSGVILSEAAAPLCLGFQLRGLLRAFARC